MQKITVTDKSTRKSYQVTGPVYETPHVWCGTGRDPELGDIFVKILRYDPNTKEGKEQHRLAKREAEVMLKAAECTKGIPKLYAHWDEPAQGRYVIVMQKMPGIPLRSWLEKRLPLQIDEKTVWLHSLILRQVAQILLEIHKKIPGISHRDVKPENIMIWLNAKHQWEVALIDFGTAALDYSVDVGTTGYQPPEQISLQDTYIGSGEAKDVFALGIMWYELLTGTRAYELMFDFYTDYDNRCWESRPSLPSEVIQTENGKRYSILFEKMTEYDPARRPSLQDIVNRIALKRRSR